MEEGEKEEAQRSQAEIGALRRKHRPEENQAGGNALNRVGATRQRHCSQILV